jgi:hypothetical protein
MVLRKHAAALSTLLSASVSAGCAGPGEYVWFQQMPSEVRRANNEYVIGVGDTLSVRVLGREEMTVKEKVRADGRIALLLIGEVEARGKRPSALKAELEGRLKDFIVSPSVVVNVDEAQPFLVLLMGEVARPGAVLLDQDPRLAHAPGNPLPKAIYPWWIKVETCRTITAIAVRAQGTPRRCPRAWTSSRSRSLAASSWELRGGTLSSPPASSSPWPRSASPSP